MGQTESAVSECEAQYNELYSAKSVKTLTLRLSNEVSDTSSRMPGTFKNLVVDHLRCRIPLAMEAAHEKIWNDCLALYAKSVLADGLRIPAEEVRKMLEELKVEILDEMRLDHAVIVEQMLQKTAECTCDACFRRRLNSELWADVEYFVAPSTAGEAVAKGLVAPFWTAFAALWAPFGALSAVTSPECTIGALATSARRSASYAVPGDFDRGQVKHEVAERLADECVAWARENKVVKKYVRVFEKHAQAFREKVMSDSSASLDFVPVERILWHDPNIANEENQSYLQKLHKQWPDLLTFSDHDLAQSYIDDHPFTWFIVVTSGSNGEKLLPTVHDLLNVSRILVFCAQPDLHREWVHRFPKIEEMVTEIDDVIRCLRAPAPSPYVSFVALSDLKPRIKAAQEWFSRPVVARAADKARVETALRCFSQIRADELKIDKTAGARRLRDAFMHPVENYAKIFRIYSEQDIHFYDTFNRQLRIKKRSPILLLFCKLAEAFLRAMGTAALQQPDLVSYATVYRGQYIEPQQVAVHMEKVGDVVFFRAFTSTSTDEQEARKFGMDVHRSKVLYEIDCTPLRNNEKLRKSAIPPLLLHSFSAFPNEQEVLLPLFASFKLVSCDKEAEGWLRVKLELTWTPPDVSAAFIYAFI